MHDGDKQTKKKKNPLRSFFRDTTTIIKANDRHQRKTHNDLSSSVQSKITVAIKVFARKKDVQSRKQATAGSWCD